LISANTGAPLTSRVTPERDANVVPVQTSEFRAARPASRGRQTGRAARSYIERKALFPRRALIGVRFQPGSSGPGWPSTD